ncbi:MAG: diguanylate cyclase domain-containing protein [Rhodanobacter sp.]
MPKPKSKAMTSKGKIKNIATIRLLRTQRTLRIQNERLRVELTAQKKQLSEALRSAESVRAELLLAVNERLLIAAVDAASVSDDQATQIESLTRASQRDALTGTPTRAVMTDRLDKAIGMARRHSLRTALLFVDLDDFKAINDELGHLAGDTVLELVARRLESAIRDSDTVSRHGGDEFLVLLAELASAADAAVIASKMIAALAEPVFVAGRALMISASVGIAVYPEDGEHASTLIANADEAMYRAKNSRHGSFVFYQECLGMEMSFVPSRADAMGQVWKSASA